MQWPLPNNVPIDAFILVDLNGNAIDFMLFSGFYNRATSASNHKVDAVIQAAEILPSNNNRKGRPSIYYDGEAIMYLLLGPGDASPINYTLKLGKGLLNYYEPPIDNYTGRISAVWSSAIGSAQIMECL